LLHSAVAELAAADAEDEVAEAALSLRELQLKFADVAVAGRAAEKSLKHTLLLLLHSTVAELAAAEAEDEVAAAADVHAAQSLSLTIPTSPMSPPMQKVAEVADDAGVMSPMQMSLNLLMLQRRKQRLHRQNKSQMLR
jgi:hypothetical protein